MTHLPLPEEITATHHCTSPESLAHALGFQVIRHEFPKQLPGVSVFSEFQPRTTIHLYLPELRRLADSRQEPFARLEQWHIAHELYHGLAERDGASPWRVRETAADAWADELLAYLQGRAAWSGAG